MYSFRNIERRVDVDQIDLAPKVLQERSHDQLVVAPDEPVPEIIMHGGPQFAKSCLTGCKGLASGHVHRLDLLPGAGRSGHIHVAAAAVLNVLSVSDQAMSSSG